SCWFLSEWREKRLHRERPAIGTIRWRPKGTLRNGGHATFSAEGNSHVAPPEISRCRSGLGGADERAAPCNSSPAQSAGNSESYRRSRRTELRPSPPRFSLL